MVHTLIDKLGKKVRNAILIALVPLVITGCSECIPGVPNNPPYVTEFNVSPTSGDAPLEVRIQFEGEDPDGENDIVEYKLIIDREGTSNDEVIIQPNPINISRTFSQEEDIKIYGRITDMAEATAESNLVSVNIYEPTSFSHTLELKNYVDFECSVTSNLEGEVLNLKVYHNGDSNPIIEKTIDGDFNETFPDMPIGDYSSVLEGNGVSDTKEVSIPDYPSEWDISNVNTDITQGEEKSDTVDLFDKNLEQMPVTFGVKVINGNITATTDGNKITRQGGEPNTTSPYEISFELVNALGHTITKTLEGTLYNLPDISGTLEDNQTNTPQSGLIQVYDGSDNFLTSVTANEQGNFSFQLDQPISEITLQARIMNGTNPESYTRTIKLSGDDVSNLIIRPQPYVDIDENGTITSTEIQDFKRHMIELLTDYRIISKLIDDDKDIDGRNPILWKFNFGEFPEVESFKKLYIFSESLEGVEEGYFSKIDIDITNRILDQNDIGGLIPGKITNQHIDDEVSKDDAERINSERGWIAIKPEFNLISYGKSVWGTGFSTDLSNPIDYFTDVAVITLRVATDEENLDEGRVVSEVILPHEFMHVIGFPGHAFRLADKSVLGNKFQKPQPLDYIAAKLLYESTYPAGERLDNILGRNWMN